MIDLHLYDNMNQTAQILIALSIMLFSGFLITRITKLLRLPNVSGYIIAWILIGPASAKLSLFLSKSITKNTKREEIKENSMIVVSTIDEDKQTLSSGGEDYNEKNI